MNGMVKRVSKAILDAMDITDSLDGTAAERYARAAIEAMRPYLNAEILEELDASKER